MALLGPLAWRVCSPQGTPGLGSATFGTKLTVLGMHV